MNIYLYLLTFSLLVARLPFSKKELLSVRTVRFIDGLQIRRSKFICYAHIYMHKPFQLSAGGVAYSCAAPRKSLHDSKLFRNFVA